MQDPNAPTVTPEQGAPTPATQTAQDIYPTPQTHVYYDIHGFRLTIPTNKDGAISQLLFKKK